VHTVCICNELHQESSLPKDRKSKQLKSLWEQVNQRT